MYFIAICVFCAICSTAVFYLLNFCWILISIQIDHGFMIQRRSAETRLSGDTKAPSFFFYDALTVGSEITSLHPLR